MADFKISASLRQQVTRRAFGCCEYCLSQAKFSPDPFSVEHIVPRGKGGSSELDNLAFSCQGCNGHKHMDVMDVEGHVSLWFAPLVK